MTAGFDFRVLSRSLPLVAAVLWAACASTVPEAMPGAPIDEKLFALSKLADERSTAGDDESAFLMRYTLLRYAVEHQEDLRALPPQRTEPIRALLLSTHDAINPDGLVAQGDGVFFVDGRKIGPFPSALLEQLSWFFAEQPAE